MEMLSAFSKILCSVSKRRDKSSKFLSLSSKFSSRVFWYVSLITFMVSSSSLICSSFSSFSERSRMMTWSVSSIIFSFAQKKIRVVVKQCPHRVVLKSSEFPANFCKASEEPELLAYRKDPPSTPSSKSFPCFSAFLLPSKMRENLCRRTKLLQNPPRVPQRSAKDTFLLSRGFQGQNIENPTPRLLFQKVSSPLKYFCWQSLSWRSGGWQVRRDFPFIRLSPHI